MSIDGTPKFSTLVIKEISAEINGMSVVLSGKAAFVDRNNNATHGWTKGEGAIWSKETLEQLMALQQLMEVDLARLHFSVAGGGVPGREPAPAYVGGIGEHLEEADQA